MARPSTCSTRTVRPTAISTCGRELTYAPSDWFQFGLVGQRTRAYQTEVETQRGLLARFTYKKADLTAHVFNPGTNYPLYVVSVAVSF